MRLEFVEAINFRNLKGKIDLEPGLSILVGENGQGKTNWLEAINVLAKTRSFKTGKIAETIRFDKDLAIVKGNIRQSQELYRMLQVNIQKTIKSCLVNGKQETTQRYLHELHAVVFNADELEIVRGQPDSRRRFLDSGIVSLHPPFTQTFTDYTKVLRQKNSLLQQAREKEMSVERAAEMLEPWNEQMTALAAKIHRGRTRFVERINEVLEKRLFGREELSIRYVSSLEGKGDLTDYAGLLAERLKLRVQAELVAGHSLVGPHRDDMEVLFDGQDIRKFGSSGATAQLYCCFSWQTSPFFTLHEENTRHSCLMT